MQKRNKLGLEYIKNIIKDAFEENTREFVIYGLSPQNIVQLYSLKFLVVFTIVYSGIKLYVCV